MKRRWIFTCFVVLLFLGLSVTAILFFVKKNRSNISFKESIKRIDSDISNAYFTRAKDLILLSLDKKPGKVETIDLLKRAYKIVLLDKDVTFFVNAAGKAWKNIPDEKITLIYAYSTIFSGQNLNRAYRILKDLKVKGEKEKSLKQLMLLELSLNGYSYDTESSDKRVKLILSAAKKKKNADPETMLELGKEYGREFLFDAALLFAKKGELSKAFELVKSINDDENNKGVMKAKLFLAYDSNNYTEAIKTVNRLLEINHDDIELTMVKADIYYLNGNLKKAEMVYNSVIKLNPKFSWIPYYNLARMYYKEGRDSDAKKLLEKAFKYFPFEKKIGLYLIQNYLSENNVVRAKEILYGLIKHYPDDDDFKLLEIQIFGERGNRSGYYSDLWKMFNKHPGSELFARYLFMILFNLNDFDGADLVLKNFSNATGNKNISWVLHYKGLLEAAKGNTDQAISYLEQSIELCKDWIALYNLAMIQLDDGDNVNAREYLTQCLNLIEPGDSKDLARVHYQLGRAYLNDNQYKLARRELEYSMELDSTNAEASLLLKKVELEANNE